MCSKQSMCLFYIMDWKICYFDVYDFLYYYFKSTINDKFLLDLKCVCILIMKSCMYYKKVEIITTFI